MLIYLQMFDTPDERTKFEQLYLTYRGLMFHVANNILNNEHDAEDAVHQAFLSVIKNFEKISEVRCPETRALLVIIVERKAIDLYRTKQRSAVVPLEEAVHGIAFSIPEDSGVAQAMERLPGRYREVLMLRFKLGYSTKEIGELFDMSQESVQKLVWRAREALRKSLERDGATL